MSVFELALLMLTILGVVLGAIGTILHMIAPRTKTSWDDRAAAGIDELRAEVVKITDALKSVMPVVQPPSMQISPPAETKPAPTTTQPLKTAIPPGGATGLVLAFLFAALAVGTIACAAQGTKLRAVEDGLAKCTAPELAQGVSALEPLMNSVVLAATSADGKQIDAGKLEAAVSKTSLETDAGQFALCALASVVTTLMTPSAPVAGAPAAAGLQVDPGALRTAFDHVRAGHAPGVHFHTAHGDI